METRKIKKLRDGMTAYNCNAFSLAVGKPPVIHDPTQEADALALVAEYETKPARRSIATDAETETETVKE